MWWHNNLFFCGGVSWVISPVTVCFQRNMVATQYPALATSEAGWNYTSSYRNGAYSKQTGYPESRIGLATCINTHRHKRLVIPMSLPLWWPNVIEQGWGTSSLEAKSRLPDFSVWSMGLSPSHALFGLALCPPWVLLPGTWTVIIPLSYLDWKLWVRRNLWSLHS